jgi:hypothetical protein
MQEVLSILLRLTSPLQHLAETDYPRRGVPPAALSAYKQELENVGLEKQPDSDWSK